MSKPAETRPALENVSVLENVRVAPGVGLLSLHAPRTARSVRPGQFVHLRVPHLDAAVLRRGTHKAPTSVMELYTTFDWEVLCREVAKLKLNAPTTTVVALRGGRAGASPVATGG